MAAAVAKPKAITGPEAVVVASQASASASVLSAALPASRRKIAQAAINTNTPATNSVMVRLGTFESVRISSFPDVDVEHEGQSAGQQQQNTAQNPVKHEG